MNVDIRSAIKSKAYEAALSLVDTTYQPERDVFAYNRTRGSILALMQKPDEAAEHYRKAVQANSADAAAHNEYGKLLFKMRRYDDAIGEINAARDLSSRKVGCVVSLSKSLDKTGRSDEAERVLREYVSDNPKSPDPNYHLALLLSQKGDAAGAVAEMKKALAMSPDNYKYNAFLGQILIKEEKPDQALPYLEKAAKLEPTNPGHLLSLGNALERHRRYDEAADCFQRFLDVTVGDRRETALVRLADIATGKGEHEKAAAYLAQASAVGSQRSKAYERRATIHRQRAGIFTEEHRRELADAKDYFEANRPNLDAAQSRVLAEIVDKGFCISSFEELFGDDYAEVWDKAEARVNEFRYSPDAKELADKIETSPDFKKDPYFKGMFKPSVVNYVMVEGQISAMDDMVQLYLNPRLLAIANSYNGMLSKIRNVNLWINPPISGKNLGERKGSQIWHRDQEDTHILKCFVYYSDVDVGSGATEYVPYSKCTPQRKYSDVLPYPFSSGYPGDFIMDKHVAMEDRIAAEGRKRSILFIDTNGFHRGGYVTKATRVIGMCTYLRPITPYADSNTKLDLSALDRSRYSHETLYGLK